MIAPVLEQLSGERDDDCKSQHGHQSPIHGKFGIRGIPALLLFHNGQLVDQQAGAMPKPMFDQWLDRHGVIRPILSILLPASSGCPTSLNKRERRASCSHFPFKFQH